ncbi:uracil-DNA glycosylase, partial [Burkholderia sp. Tr-862]|uniref:uracil-DNA glycosylase n=1 Tax=Burkholderia sp. Tr-862 TaxID=2608331 RepID=UPI001FFCEF19
MRKLDSKDPTPLMALALIKIQQKKLDDASAYLKQYVQLGDKQGEPFVGQAGKLLDNMLQSLALKRGENVYIANVIKCRPPGNRNPEPDEVARCEPYLQRQVALVKPKLIVALGRFAAQTLLKTDASIASLRGRVHTYEGVPVIVTYHPAYLLRSLQDKSKAWADLCLARDTFQQAGDADATGPVGQ